MSGLNSYYAVTREEMEAFLLPRGFVLLNDPLDRYMASWPRDLREGYRCPVQELVYSHRVRPPIPRFSIRVFSGISFSGHSRAVGDDAIRVLCAWLDRQPPGGGEPVVRIVGSLKRVHRIQTWAKNLQNRIDTWRDMLGPECPECGAPMAERHKKKNRGSYFWGCSRFPSCRATLDKKPMTKGANDANSSPHAGVWQEGRGQGR